MNKKIILALLVMVVAAVSIAAVSAGEDTIKIDGIKFNIPDGFEKVNSTSNTTFFSNDDGENYSIEVKDDSFFVIRDPKTINGKEGSFYTSSSGKVRFAYEEGSKVVNIIASDESLFESIIPES